MDQMRRMYEIKQDRGLAQTCGVGGHRQSRFESNLCIYPSLQKRTKKIFEAESIRSCSSMWMRYHSLLPTLPTPAWVSVPCGAGLSPTAINFVSSPYLSNNNLFFSIRAAESASVA